MQEEQDRATMRYEVRRALRLLVEEAKRQKCLEDLLCFPDVFVAFIVAGHPTISEAVGLGMVTMAEVSAWLEVLLYGAGDHGTAC